MRCTGNLHLGHFFLFQQVKDFLNQHKEYEIVFLLADQHGIIQHFGKTTDIKEDYNIRKSTLNIIKTLVSLNFSVKQILISSYLNAVNDLTWIFTEFIKLNEIFFIPNIKTSIGKDINVSKLLYSVLMCAEIIACNTDMLILGKDQLPNFKISKKILERINSNFNNQILTIPNVHFIQVLTGIYGRNKMSKSDNNIIDIFANYEQIKQQIFLIKTSSTPFYQETLSNTILFKIFSFLFEKELIWCHNNRLLHSEVKTKMFQLMMQYFEIYRTKFHNISIDQESILWKQTIRNTILWNRKYTRVIRNKLFKLLTIK